MSLRNRIRERLNVKQPNGPNDPEVNNEEILNELRRSEEEYLTSGQIADGLPVDSPQINNRLKEMKGERVTKRNAGQAYLWTLHEEETSDVVDPRLGTIVSTSTTARRVAKSVQKGSKIVVVGGFILLLISVTVAVSDARLPFITWSYLLSWGYLSSIVGLLFLASAWVTYLLMMATPRLAEWYLLGERH